MSNIDQSPVRADSQHDSSPGADSVSSVDEASSVDKATVAIDVNRLIIGRALRFPIHDKSGILLLRAGSLISSEFKRKLERRDVSSVCVHPEDAGLVALHESTPAGPKDAESARPASFDSDVSRKLDGAIAQGLPFVSNQGPPARRSLVYHGTQPYDADQREAAEESREETTETVDALMQETAGRGDVDGRVIASAAAAALSRITGDMDLMLSLPNDVRADRRLAHHGVQMALLGMAMGVELGLNAENVSRIGVAGMVHDWGMLKVPEALRDAARPLAMAEQLEIRRHPIYTLNLLERVSGLPSLTPIIAYQVHEKIDGTGYPRGRVERNIHLFARILHVADIFVALTAPRPWRPPYSAYAAMCSLLSSDNPHGADPLVVRALLRVKSLFPIGSYVTLSDASVAQVIRANGDRYTEPIVQLFQDGKGRSLRGAGEAALIDLSQSPLRVTEAMPTPGRDERTQPGHFLYKRMDAGADRSASLRRPHVPLTGRAEADVAERAIETPHIPKPHLATPRRASATRRVLRQDGEAR